MLAWSPAGEEGVGLGDDGLRGVRGGGDGEADAEGLVRVPVADLPAPAGGTEISTE